MADTERIRQRVEEARRTALGIEKFIVGLSEGAPTGDERQMLNAGLALRKLGLALRELQRYTVGAENPDGHVVKWGGLATYAEAELIRFLDKLSQGFEENQSPNDESGREKTSEREE